MIIYNSIGSVGWIPSSSTLRLRLVETHDVVLVTPLATANCPTPMHEMNEAKTAEEVTTADEVNVIVIGLFTKNINFLCCTTLEFRARVSPPSSLSFDF